MARCWTCGSVTAVETYSCPNCKGLEELHKIRASLDKQSRTQEGGVSKVTGQLGAMSASLETIVSVVKWGLEEVYWTISQQTAVLLHMDRLLQTPAQPRPTKRES